VGESLEDDVVELDR
jgi:hypothetical protein